jgi:hypothetical protein
LELAAREINCLNYFIKQAQIALTLEE